MISGGSADQGSAPPVSDSPAAVMPVGDAADFGPWVRRRRVDQGITQEALADRCGIAVRTLRYLEAGRTAAPRWDTRRAIVTALNQLGNDVPDRPSGPAAVPAQLPPDLAAFVGRSARIEAMDRMGTASATAMVSCLIVGAPGVGKSALAVHWAHRARAGFPGGQLYADLRGFGPAAPTGAPEVLRGFLEALGVPAERIPAGVDEQIAAYRTVLAGRRVLVVLDNARSAEQVRSLLPGTVGSMAVVTSRNQLLGLVAAQAAHPLTINAGTGEEGREILTARLGADRVRAEPAAAAEIVRVCAGLPLALAVVGARAAMNPDFSLGSLARELTDAESRLTAVDGGDPAGDVRSAMSWSYAALSGRAATMFRALGQHPLPEVSIGPAAGMLGCSRPDARAALTELVHAHLLTEHRPGRFVMQGLLHAYAGELSQEVDDERLRRATRGRLYDFYAYSANHA
jgi:transcriptional regulator with XRE-family HTH domain